VSDQQMIFDTAFDGQGNLLACGQLLTGGAARALLIGIGADGQINWANTWGNAFTYCAGVAIGHDGLAYVLTSARQQGAEPASRMQLSQFDGAGNLGWEALCLTPAPSTGSQHCSLDLDPQGNLWMVYTELVDPEPVSTTIYPYLASFTPQGSLRFARQWVGDIGATHRAMVYATDMAVNRYGVAIITGEAPSKNGVWTDYPVTLEDPGSTISHPELALNDGPFADPRDPVVTELQESGTVDALDSYRRQFIMLYRP